MKRIFKVLILVLALNMTCILITEGQAVSAKTETQLTFKERMSEKRKIKKSKSRIKKATKAINKGKYEKVFEILKPELIYDNQEKVLLTMVEKYLEAKEAFEIDDVTIAEKSIEEIDKSYEKLNIAKDINNLKKEIGLRKSELEKIENQIKEVAKLIEEDKLDQATSIIEVLDKDNTNEYQKANIKVLKESIEKRKIEIAEAKRLEEERIKAEEEEAKRLAEIQRQEEIRIAEQERKRQEEVAANNNYNSANNNSSSNSSSVDSSSSGGAYYIIPGNRYYHISPSCKFLEGAATTAVNDVSNKFPCNCVKYN